MRASAAKRVPAGNLAFGDASARPLYGRDRELGVLTGLLDRLREGAGGALVVRGVAGIGKSSLLAVVADRAADHGIKVLSAAGFQSEMHLPFSGLHQLLRPILERAERLPPRQRAALRAAFGLSGEVVPELFLIALATLELITDEAAGSPVLLIAEDAQWLDQTSSAVLALVARRLGADPVVMLMAVRDEPESSLDEAGLPELQLEGLDENAAAALLDSQAPGLEPSLRERLLREAAGNPLALVELPAALGPEQLGGDALPPARLPLTARLERGLRDAGVAAASGYPLAVAGRRRRRRRRQPRRVAARHGHCRELGPNG